MCVCKTYMRNVCYWCVYVSCVHVIHTHIYRFTNSTLKTRKYTATYIAIHTLIRSAHVIHIHRITDSTLKTRKYTATHIAIHTLIRSAHVIHMNILSDSTQRSRKYTATHTTIHTLSDLHT